jgi:putative SOS response-associated peptidase YedK
LRHQWNGEGQTIKSNTIIVTDAAKGLRTMHDHMPAMLSPEGTKVWLDAGEHAPARLKPLLSPYARPELEAYFYQTHWG